MLLIVLYHFLEVNAHDDDNSGATAGLGDEKVGVGAVKLPAAAVTGGPLRNMSAGWEKSGGGGMGNKGAFS